MTRVITRRYSDPLDLIWTSTAARIGFRISRSDTVYASKDAGAELTIGTPETLDEDDCLAQMIFHEMCHALIQGPGAHREPDWGLCNRTDRDVVREHACLRLQATLSTRVGLRRVLAPTTEYRAFYDSLLADPLEGAPDEERSLVVTGLDRAQSSPFAPHLDRALSATVAITQVIDPFTSETPDSLFAKWRTD